MKLSEWQNDNGEQFLLMENERYALKIALTYGIRIVGFNLLKEENMFGENLPIEMPIGDDEWKIRGGHRMWYTPETNPETYLPDNDPITYEMEGKKLKLTQRANPTSEVQKGMTLEFTENGQEVIITHKLTNHRTETMHSALWALTVMKTGGKALLPLTARDIPLLHTRNFSYWPYTNLNDPRYTIHQDALEIVQDTCVEAAFKMGYNNEDGWAAYALGDNTFIKRFKHIPDAHYPDGGCSYEVYTNHLILEMESLSPIQAIKPGESATYVEKWSIHKQLPFNRGSMAEVIEKL